MAFKNKQVVLRYVTDPKPTIFAYLVGKEGKNVEIIQSVQLPLETYQIESGLVTDTEVIAKKLVTELTMIDKMVKDKMIFVYDTPNILRFSTIVPKMSMNKVKPIAEKELNDFFRSGTDAYKYVNRVVTLPEKGIVFYYDLVRKDFIESMDKLAVAMDFYIDQHATFPLAISSAFEAKYPNENTFLIYKDELVTHVMLLIKSKMVDVLSLHKDESLDGLVSHMELLRNKHLFAFEKVETSSVHLIMETSIKENYKEALEKNHGFEVADSEIVIDEIIKNTYEHISDFADGFYIKV